MKILYCALMAAALACAAGSSAAVARTPANLAGLVGALFPDAERELRRLGYTTTHKPAIVEEGRLTYWRRGDECVAIITGDARFQSITRAGLSLCQTGGPGSQAAANANGAKVKPESAPVADKGR